MRTLTKAVLTLTAGIIGMALVTGCASIMHGGTQGVPIKSHPSDAGVKVFDETEQLISSATTPCTIRLKRAAGVFAPARYRVVIAKEGYATREVQLRGSVSGWYIIGNLFSWDLLGWLIVDPITGAMWTLSPSEVSADLQAPQSVIFDRNDGLTVVMLSQVPLEYQKVMKPVGGQR